jgi:hypothetical protein
VAGFVVDQLTDARYLRQAPTVAYRPRSTLGRRAAMDVLVIGGTGLLGRPVPDGPRAAGHRVRLLARQPERAQALLGPGFTYVAGDVGDDDDAYRPAAPRYTSASAGPANQPRSTGSSIAAPREWLRSPPPPGCSG